MVNDLDGAVLGVLLILNCPDSHGITRLLLPPTRYLVVVEPSVVEWLAVDLDWLCRYRRHQQPLNHCLLRGESLPVSTKYILAGSSCGLVQPWIVPRWMHTSPFFM
jgi:hypothetical protein